MDSEWWLMLPSKMQEKTQAWKTLGCPNNTKTAYLPFNVYSLHHVFAVSSKVIFTNNELSYSARSFPLSNGILNTNTWCELLISIYKQIVINLSSNCKHTTNELLPEQHISALNELLQQSDAVLITVIRRKQSQHFHILLVPHNNSILPLVQIISLFKVFCSWIRHTFECFHSLNHSYRSSIRNTLDLARRRDRCACAGPDVNASSESY